MKKRISLSALSALLASAVMLFFTFFAWGWFSDVNGVQFYFEIPVGFQNGHFSTAADIVWTAAPLLCLAAQIAGLFVSEKGEKILLPLCSFPLALYAVLQFLLYASGKEGHFTVLISLFFFLLLGALTTLAAFLPHIRRPVAKFSLLYGLLEAFFFILSVLTQTKLSQFYFSQTIALGHLSSFRYSFILFSVFFYHFFYALSLASRLFCAEKKAQKTKEEIAPLETPPSCDTPPSEEEEEAQGPELSESEVSSEEITRLTLEDLGIEP